MRFVRSASTLAIVAAVALLSACGGDGGGEEKKASQVAAKVNKDELTVHQINAAMPRMNNPTEEQVKAATKRVLERLIDQQLLIQKAMESKLDRDPAVLSAIENSRREILARAYVERVMGGAGTPSDAQISEFFNAHPELFAERRVYRLQEVALAAKGPELEALKQALPPMNSLQEVVEYAKAHNIRATTNASVRAAEQLPMEFAARIQKMRDGEVVAVPGPNGIAVVQIVQSQTQPLNLEQAKPFITRFLQNRSRMELAQSEVKNLRSTANIEYVGEFANMQGEEPEPAAAAPGSSLEQQANQPAIPGVGSGDDHQDALEKGLSGLKK